MKNRNLVEQIGNQRINILFNSAESRIDNKEFNLAKKYIIRLRKISSHYKIKIPKKMKNKICNKCNMILVPGITCNVKIVSVHRYVSYECKTCRQQKHIFY
ncbi:MAG: ribonuclease P Rpr2/Rpp21/SNM1 subunit [Candidatus Marsarchaeota archaeon]|nr:ribonuclease P Rpr2/Rpp21/SNM1 subunit [Candidatus Marsarchaeota archaeon]MCL5094928.1 ribonuclease P Rpr2/Rpp21/SNM1 subunit [Candidatus Marsarchaeota archaeon]